eukprot:879566-Prymnesium_polylepis.1
MAASLVDRIAATVPVLAQSEPATTLHVEEVSQERWCVFVASVSEDDLGRLNDACRTKLGMSA